MAVVGPAWRRPAPAAPVVPVAVATLERVEGPVTWIGMEAPAVGAALRAGSILETGAEGRAAVLLRTGVALRADAGTHLRLESAVEIGLDRGAVYLDTGGRAGPVPAVAVRTPLGMVRDVGTRFEVRLGEDAIQVSVRAGRVRLERPDGSHETPSGVRLTVRGDGAPVRRAVAAAGPEWDWVQRVAPPFRLEGRRLDEYLAWFGSETGLRIEYGDPAIAADAAAVVLHGSIEGLLPGDTLEAVLPTCGLRHRVAGERVILERAAPGEHSVTSRPLSPRGTERQGGVR
jgi:ferric-dicitrate binding protein FerR (iron transport regulator)